MKRALAILLGAAAALAATLAADAHDRVYWIYNMAEMTGSRAPAGASFGQGVEFGFKDVNRSGGVITRRLLVAASDSESNSKVAVAGALDAIDMQAYAVVGPLYAETMEAAVDTVVKRGIPIFVGGEVADITQRGIPFIFRAAMSRPLVMGKLARWLKARGVRAVDILSVRDSFGTGGREAAIDAFGEAGITIGADLVADSGQSDFDAPAAKIKASPADAVLVYLNEDGAIRALRALAKAGVGKAAGGKAIVGTGTLVGRPVLDGAGAAAEGVQAFVEITPELPGARMKDVRERFRKSYRHDPDEQALLGYVAAQVIKAATERVGNFNTFAFVYTMKTLVLKAADVPEVLVDLRYDANGDVERGGFIVEVRDHRHAIVAELPLS